MPQTMIVSRARGHLYLNSKTTVRLALGVALAGCIVCGQISAANAGDSIYDRILGVIGIKSDDDTINYSERSPLVVPPTRDLPPPAAPSAPPSPDWPHDPDIARAARSKAKETVGPHDDYVLDSSRPLRPEELNAPMARTANRGSRGNNSYSADYPEGQREKNKGLFSLDMFKKDQYATFTGEPPRTSLTDPPAGYMTPSPDQPYGIGSDKHYKYEVPTVGQHGEIGR